MTYLTLSASVMIGLYSPVAHELRRQGMTTELNKEWIKWQLIDLANQEPEDIESNEF